MHKNQSHNIQDTFKRLHQRHWKDCPYFYCYPFEKSGPTLQERQRLRAILLNHLERSIPLSKKNKSELSTPGRKPQIPSVSISISHCKVLGGFVFSTDSNVSIGLDLEEAKRVKPSVITHICQKKEVQQAPMNALLWVAKESSFKCLPSNPGQFLSHVCILNWQILQSNAYSFCFQTKDDRGQGIAFLEENLAIAYSRINKNKRFL